MTIQDVLNEINRQSILQATAAEVYEEEACEVLVFDCILEYYRATHPDSAVLKQYRKGNVDEEWMLISELFTHYVSDQLPSSIEKDIVFLLEEFYQRFYLFS